MAKEHFEWAKAEKGWRTKDGRIIPLSELSEAELNKYYKLASHKELVYMNKSYLFADKRSEMESEAQRRGIELKRLDTDFHNNELVLKSKSSK